MTTIKDVIVSEIRGDMTTLCQKAFSDVGGLKTEAAVNAITDTFIADLIDEDHMAYTQTGSLIGNLPNNELSAMLVPVDKHDTIVRLVQDTHKKSYHSYHNECFTDNGWKYRSWAYGRYGVTIPGTQKMTRAMIWEDGIANRSADASVVSTKNSSVDGCTTDAVENTSSSFTTWHMSDQSVMVSGAEYYILVGIAASQDADATKKSSIQDYYFADLKKYL